MFSKVNGDNTTETGKVSNQPREDFVWNKGGVFFEAISTIIYELHSLRNQVRNIAFLDREKLKEVINSNVLFKLTCFKENIGRIEKHPLFTNFTIAKFFCSIIKDDNLRKGLEKLSDPAKNSDIMSGATLCSQLSEIITDFKLKEKMRFLKELKEKSNFAALKQNYSDEWLLIDLMDDQNFKQEFIDKVVNEKGESASQSLKENIDGYMKLVVQGKQVASKYFNKKGTNFQAYCEESDDTGRVLNVNLINHHGNEPIKISDILQQEKNIGKLNIYCNKKHEVYAHQDKDKKRYYVFEKGAHYEMTSTWPIKDESGRVVLTCTMVMNVSSDGITKILKFNGEDYTLLSEEDKKLIEKNEELFIEGLPLYKAVGKFLGLNAKCEECFIPLESPIENNPSEHSNQTEVNSQDNETSQPIATQTEVNSRDTETQTETTSKQITDLESKNQRLKEENTEYKQFIEAGLQEMDKEHSVLKGENQLLRDRLENIGVEKEKSDQKLTETEQKTKELAAQNGNLLDKLKKKEQKSKAEKDKMYELSGPIQDKEYLHRIISGLQKEQLIINYSSDERNMLGKSGTEDDFDYDEYIRQNNRLGLLDKAIELVKVAGCILSSDDGYITDKETDSTHPRSSFQTLVKTMRCPESGGRTM